MKIKRIFFLLALTVAFLLLCACGEQCYVCNKRATKTWVGYDVCQDCYSKLAADYYREKMEKEQAEEQAKDKGMRSLKVGNLSLTSNSSYTICEGSVTNNGSDTYYFVKVKVVYKDGSGNVIDTDTTYVCGSEGLAPGETAKFRSSVDKDYNIDKVYVSVYDFDVD